MNRITIGIAGYMGSGKTTCTKLLTGLGGYEINADREAKELMLHSTLIKDQLSDEFGTIVIKDGYIQSSVLGEMAFRSPESIVMLNTIVHPPLIDHLKKCIEIKTDEVIILDAALIPLWDVEEWFDYRIWVDADFETRLNRLHQQRVKGEINEHELTRRMKIQEQLFDPPSRDKWVYIQNKYSEMELIASVLEWIRATPELTQSLYIESHF